MPAQSKTNGQAKTCFRFFFFRCGQNASAKSRVTRLGEFWPKWQSFTFEQFLLKLQQWHKIWPTFS
jgi:hypothetical protein